MKRCSEYIYINTVKKNENKIQHAKSIVILLKKGSREKFRNT